jgi:hypothetical protein
MILKHIVHGQCIHDQCLDDMGQCIKHFPKIFQDHITMDTDHYIVYRRQDDGRSSEKNGCGALQP